MPDTLLETHKTHKKKKFVDSYFKRLNKSKVSVTIYTIKLERLSIVDGII